MVNNSANRNLTGDRYASYGDMEDFETVSSLYNLISIKNKN